MLAPGQVVRGLAGSYRCGEKLAEGGFGIAFAGTRESDDAPLLLKELRVERLKDWKAVDLFEREAKILEKLDHPRIPAYLDFFAWDGEKATPAAKLTEAGSLVLVQARIRGDSLDARIEKGAHFSSAEAERLFRGLLEILSYLHGLHPPVIHRDINPANIVLGEDGSPYLVDFGGVQDRIRLAARGSTQIGTVGFMPLEQISGASRPSTDLYALGFTMLAALSHLAPHEMPTDEETSKAKVAEIIPTAPANIRAAIDAMVEPLASKRVASVAGVLAILDGRPTTSNRHRWPWYAAAAALAVAVGAAATFHPDASSKVESAAPPPPPLPTPETPPAPTVFADRRLVPAVWKGHVRSEPVGVPGVVKGAPCTVNANLERFDERKVRFGSFTVRCTKGGSQAIVYEQKKDWIDLDSAAEHPGDEPGTYTIELNPGFAKDEDGLSFHANTLQNQFELKRGGSNAFILELFLEARSEPSNRALLRESETKEVVFRPSLHRTGKVVARTGNAPAPMGGRCRVDVDARFVWEYENEKKNCDIRIFCGDEFLNYEQAACSTAVPFKFEMVSFHGVNDQRHTTSLDFGKNIAKYADKADAYSLEVRLE